MPPPEEYPQQPHLPTPRTFLTSLLNSLSTSAAPPGANPISTPSSPSNPLKSLSPAQKSLLATLHVLFQPPTLLQALDLLDRGLVTRVCISEQDPRTELQIPETGRRGNGFYLVRSAQARTRYAGAAGGWGGAESHGGLVYRVRLRAWSCDCAAFAFAAFPPVFSTPGEEDLVQGDFEDGDGDGESEFEVGGLSFNGRDHGDEGVPVCKHLLACVLAERWDGVFGAYVKERVVGREEGGGICGG